MEVDSSMELLQPEDTEEEEEVLHMKSVEGGDQPSDQAQTGSATSSGTKELKLTLEGLERYFVFGKFVRTETRLDGKYSRQVHTGKSMCTKCGKVYSFTTQSRAHLKSHYVKMHKVEVPHLVAAMEENSKRGRTRTRSTNSNSDPPKRRQLSLEESFHKKDVVSDEMLRKLYLRARTEHGSDKILTSSRVLNLIGGEVDDNGIDFDSNCLTDSPILTLTTNQDEDVNTCIEDITVQPGPSQHQLTQPSSTSTQPSAKKTQKDPPASDNIDNVPSAEKNKKQLHETSAAIHQNTPAFKQEEASAKSACANLSKNNMAEQHRAEMEVIKLRKEKAELERRKEKVELEAALARKEKDEIERETAEYERDVAKLKKKYWQKKLLEYED